MIPPQRNATLSQNSNTAMQERDRHIRAIERHGRREWYKLSGYTKPKHGGERGLSLQGDHQGRRCGLERWRGNELNTELGARYSTRWLRSGCPIRTAPGDSATGTGRSAICSGPCNNRRCVPRSVEKERRPPLGHQSIRSCGNLRVFENLAQKFQLRMGFDSFRGVQRLVKSRTGSRRCRCLHLLELLAQACFGSRVTILLRAA